MRENLHILVVDDDRNLAKTLVDILVIKGYNAEMAHSGRQAREKINRGFYDCILSDIKMPDINGIELCKIIKTWYPELPVVLMTAHTYPTLLREGEQAGVLMILDKPLDHDLLLSCLAHLHQKLVTGRKNIRRSLQIA